MVVTQAPARLTRPADISAAQIDKFQGNALTGTLQDRV
jgi:hypothetical protein